MRNLKLAITILLLAAISCLTGCSTVPAGAPSGDASGFIKTWLLCGPFPNPPNKPAEEGKEHIYDHTPPCVGLDTDYLTEHGGEEKIYPVAGMKHKKKDGKTVEWFKHASPENKIIFRKAITNTPNVVAYAFTTVDIDKAGDYLFGLGSDEGVRVWVNGELVHDKLIARAILEDDDLISVKLNKGENRILVKVEQGWGGWGFALRIVSPDEVFSEVETDLNLMRVNVFLRRQKADKIQKVELRSNSKTVAKGLLAAENDEFMAECELKVPFPSPGEELGTLDIVVQDKVCGQLDVPSLSEARARTFQWQRPKAYPGFVFADKSFPGIDFEKPLWITRLIGQYEISTDFYDSDFNKVKTAEKPGRYGAVAEIKTEDGEVYRRFVTLFRQTEDVKWQEEKEFTAGASLPLGLGIDPKVVEKQQETLTAYTQWRFVSGLREDPYSAILLAWLYSITPDEPEVVQRTNPHARDQQWWATLKTRLGILEVPHLLYLPEGYDEDKNKKWPLVMFLHGAGERGEDLEILNRHGLQKMVSEGREFPFILVSPQCSLGSWWATETAELGIFLDQIEDKYHVDPKRIYCTGLSMGGYGTWAMGMAYPDRFAALAPICGGGDLKDVARIKGVPIWAFHGAKDSTVPPECSQVLIDALKEMGASPKLTIYPDAYHNSWTQAYNDPELLEWLLKQEK